MILIDPFFIEAEVVCERENNNNEHKPTTLYLNFAEDYDSPDNVAT